MMKRLGNDKKFRRDFDNLPYDKWIDEAKDCLNLHNERGTITAEAHKEAKEAIEMLVLK